MPPALAERAVRLAEHAVAAVPGLFGYVGVDLVLGDQADFVIEIDVPDDVWAKHATLDVATLPPTWAAIPAGRASVAIGSAWLSSLRSAILMVPSVIIPEELAALINPRHADAAVITARAVRVFDYDRLFRPMLPTK